MREERRVAIAMTGPRNAPFWTGDERDAKFDVFDLKGMMEEFLEQFGLRGIELRTRAESTRVVPGIGRGSTRRNCLSANLASCCPSLAKKYDLRDAVLLAELNLDLLLARRNAESPSSRLPHFPPSAAMWRCSCRKRRRMKPC